jgi:hypothetical protein
MDATVRTIGRNTTTGNILQQALYRSQHSLCSSCASKFRTSFAVPLKPSRQ